MMDHFQYYAEPMHEAELEWIKNRRHAAKIDKPLDNNITGLALSGGGIRSAVFNLGVIQALHKNQKLTNIDIMSSVSGGGYIASALTWFNAKKPEQFPFGSSRVDHDKLGGAVVAWLRAHSSFLTPGNGINSMSLFTAIFTGSLINLLILLPLCIFAIYLASMPIDINLPWLTKPLTFFHLLHACALLLLIFCLIFMLITAISTGLYGLKKRHTEQCRKCVSSLFSWGVLTYIVSLIPFIHDLFDWLSDWVVETSISVSLLGIIITWVSSKKSSTTHSFLKSLLLNIGLLMACLGFFVFIYHFAQAWLVSPHQYLHHIFIALLALSFILAISCNINLISMHGYYRNRLRDAFMPTYIPETNQYPAQKIASWHEAQACYLAKLPNNDGPLHILNCNVELTDSKQPKYRSRAGDCFSFSPLYCGSNATGFMATNRYQNGNADLASICAISGAAVATNTSQTRSKTLNFILGLLNLRLGCWLPNPYKYEQHNWRLKPLWYFYMFRDMFGAGLNEKQKYIHLSDGGHFENLAVYELVRRKCKTIIASDAAADPNYNFKDLAKLTEMIRVDFGAQLIIDTSAIIPDENGISESAHAIGEIIYNCGMKATFIYIKSSIIDHVSADVLGYKKQNPSFPNQSTIDQFFDEFQFEAYRELAFQVTHKLLKQQPQLIN